MCRHEDYFRWARRLARERPSRGRREYVHVGCGKNVPVFHAPGKAFHDRSAAWVAAGMFAVGLLFMCGSCLAAGGTGTRDARMAASASRGTAADDATVAASAGREAPAGDATVAASAGREAPAGDAPVAASATGTAAAGDAPVSASAARGSAGSFDLGQLMKVLGQRKQGEVSYQQEDYFAILDQPVPSSGVLSYRAPDRLEKRTLRPRASSLIVEGDELTVQRGQRTYRMQLSAYPQVAPLVDAMRDTLTGNEQGLERVFKVTLTGSLRNWKLRLVPLDRAVARKVSRVEIAGSGDEIRSVEILQVGGDRSVMTLGPPPASGAAGTDPAPAPP